MLELVVLPDDSLRIESKEIKNIDGTLEKFVNEMYETMDGAEGIGLAGVQVGRLDRIFVVHVPDHGRMAFINPRITAFSDKTDKYEEGCLSIPGIYADVHRPMEIEINYYDVQGKEQILIANDLLARVIQHEYDHLNGKLFYDYLRPGQQKRFLNNYYKTQNLADAI